MPVIIINDEYFNMHFAVRPFYYFTLHEYLCYFITGACPVFTMGVLSVMILVLVHHREIIIILFTKIMVNGCFLLRMVDKGSD